MLCDRCQRQRAPLELLGEKLLCDECYALVALQKRPKLPFKSRKPRQIEYYDAHIEEAREKNRARYRQEHGIPLDAPLLLPGRPKKKIPSDILTTRVGKSYTP